MRAPQGPDRPRRGTDDPERSPWFARLALTATMVPAIALTLLLFVALALLFLGR